MCGRYYIDEDLGSEIGAIVQDIDARMARNRAGDIYPSQTAPVICGKGGRLWGTEMKWGLAGRDKKLLINARAETALDRPTFSESVRKRRCIIPARHFYEWDGQKQKVVFSHGDQRALYMAGFFRMEEDGAHFIILTTAANDSVRPVHERMPLVLEAEELAPWIREEARTGEFLEKIPPGLEWSQEYEQMSLFL